MLAEQAGPASHRIGRDSADDPRPDLVAGCGNHLCNHVRLSHSGATPGPKKAVP